MATQEQSKHGGANRGQGRKQKYGEPTTTLWYTCPVSKIDEMKGFIEAKLKRYLPKKKK